MSKYIPNEHGELTALDTAIDTSTQMPAGEIGAAFAKMILSLFAIVALLVLTYLFTRKLIQNRLQKNSENSAIQILEKRMISPKTMLYLVEVNDKQILLAESQLEIKRLETFKEI